MDTFAPSNLPVAVTRTGAVAERAEGIKMSNYADLDHLYQFVEPMDLDHSNLSKCLVISWEMPQTTQEPKISYFRKYQAIQWGNTTAVMGTLDKFIDNFNI